MANPSRWGSALRLDGDIGHTYSSDIAALSGGRFVATWLVETASGEQQVRAQLFSADGTRQGAEIIRPVTGQFGMMAVTALSDGGFAIAWEDRANNRQIVRAQVFDHDGNALGAPVFVNDATATEWERTPQIAAGAGGGFAVTWLAQNTTAFDLDARMRVFNADGSPAAGRPAIEVTGVDYWYNPDVATLSDGRTVVVWHESGSAYARIFSADASSASGPIALNNAGGSPYKPVVTALTHGGFAAVWTDASATGHDIYAQIFDGSGNPGARVPVNAPTAGAQSDPAVALLHDGRLVVAWADDNINGQSGGSYSNIRVQLLNVDGTRSGAELLVNADAVGYGVNPSVTALADGRFVVSWHDGGPTANGLGRGEYAQIIDPRDGAVTLAGTPLGDDWVGTRFDDTFNGAAGDDHIDGGAGDDTAIFVGRRAEYTVTDHGDRIVVSGPEGIDTLLDIEHLRFASDGPGAPSIPVDHVSGLFDTRFYLGHNADVSAAGVSALDHYNTFGWREGRDPNAFFDSTGYLAANPDVHAAGHNPMEHYHASGWREGRDPSAAFDTTLYLVHNPDVAAAGVDPLEHYLQHGRSEGRAVYAAVGKEIVGGFDAEYYVFHNPDVAVAGVDPLAHFQIYGWHEGRDPNAWFDTSGYLAHYADVAAAGVNPLEHYMLFGWKEGRDPSAGFDTLGYLTANPDVAAAGINPLEHYLLFGIYEGRQAISDGMWH